MTSIWLQYKIKKTRCEERLDSYKKKIPIIGCIRLFFRTIQPDKMIRTIEKMIAYGIALIVSFILDYFTLGKGLDEFGELFYFSITNLVYLLALFTEAISIIRNLGKITNNAVFRTIEYFLTDKKNKIS